MSNRWLRFGIALLAIGAAGAAGYRIFQQDQRLAAGVTTMRAVEQSAETALVTISELKAAMHAYVADGQGDAFWTARAATLLDGLRTTILELDGPTAAAGGSLTETLDLTDRLAAAERRAREHVRRGERLMAGEIIFTDARDLLDAMRDQVAAARAGITAANATAHDEIRREQVMLALGAAGILAFATLLLVIPASAPDGATAGRPSEASAPPAPSAPGAPSAPDVTPSARSAPGPAAATVSLADAAAVCTELGRVSQSIEIDALLDRAARVLGASGAIVWMTTPDRHELYPAAGAGYDARVLARIGSIRRDASNVTAAALRDAAPRTTAGLGPSAAAMAVPLMTPLGPVGVFSAELRDVDTVDEARLAVATIFAAQFATLLGSMAPAASDAGALSASAAVKAQA